MDRSFNELILEIRPYIIKGIQDAKVVEYEQSYKKRNGKMPSAEEINQFISILIANGTVKRDADEIVNELIERYSKNIFTKLLINSSILLGSAGCTFQLLALFIIYVD